MKNRMINVAIGMAVVAFIAVVKLSAAEMMFACPHCKCPDGCVWQEVCTYSCKMEEKMVPIKKIVYESKEIPYCRHMPPSLCGCCCPQCESCPKFKTVLIKKEITCGEKCETKCVPVEHKEMVLVPCRSCGHRPNCAPCAPGCGPCAQTNGVPGAQQPQYVQGSQPQQAPRIAPLPPMVDPTSRKPVKGIVPEVVVAEPFQVR